MALRKGATFHASTNVSPDTAEPVLDVRRLPSRSPTDLTGLYYEDVENRWKRVAGCIDDSDRLLSTLPSNSLYTGNDSSPPRERLDVAVGDPSDSHPVGRGSSGLGMILPSHGRTNVRHEKHHTSDSGIGSTVSGTLTDSDQDDAASETSFKGRGRANAPLEGHSSQTKDGCLALAPHRSMINRTVYDDPHRLSLHGVRQIERHILRPLSRRSELVDFQPLVQDIPRRIGEKEILCLRDLEKILVYLAPVSESSDVDRGEMAHWIHSIEKARAKSSDSYLLFCETWIQCFHTTIDRISERDQRRPTDAPYTNGYFLDLVGQVRNYARVMAASRQRQARGEPATEMDYSPSDKIVLQGGLSQTGRPAQLMRVKDGKTIPLDPSHADASPRTRVHKAGRAPSLSKRSFPEQSPEAEDSVHRSMARRRKLGPGKTMKEPAAQVCRDCGKAYKRPCDLTKHEKTHSRPWKCRETDCKYYSYGWPTETERDRHVNDKHSADPAMHVCHFPPCTYKSKRESNCKQHMEKAHGWTYVRAKGTGKKPAGSPSAPTPETPQFGTPNMLSFGAPTPMTRGSSSRDHGSERGQDDFPTNAFYRDHSPHNFSPSAVGHDGVDEPLFSFNDYPDPDIPLFGSIPGAGLPTMAPAGFEPNALGHSTALASNRNPGINERVTLMDGSDMSNNYNAQLLTPDLSVDRPLYGSFSLSPDMYVPGVPEAPPVQPMNNLSPRGLANIMLYSPASGVKVEDDEGFGDFFPQSTGPIEDFPLYPPDWSTFGTTEDDVMFPELSNVGGGLGYRISQPSASLGDPQPAFYLTEPMQMDPQGDM